MIYTQRVVIVDTPSLTLSFDEANQWLYAEWKGQHDVTSVLAGCAAVRHCLEQTHCDKILDDSSQALSDWEEVADWVGQHFFNVLARQGVRHFAWVCPSDPTCRRSIELAKRFTKQPNVVLFDDITSAQAWLHAQA